MSSFSKRSLLEVWLFKKQSSSLGNRPSLTLWSVPLYSSIFQASCAVRFLSNYICLPLAINCADVWLLSCQSPSETRPNSFFQFHLRHRQSSRSRVRSEVYHRQHSLAFLFSESKRAAPEVLYFSPSIIYFTTAITRIKELILFMVLLSRFQAFLLRTLLNWICTISASILSEAFWSIIQPREGLHLLS